MNENYAISEEKINEIRSSVDIVEVIGEYIPLTGKGKNFFAVCPFHDDHSPSMSISKDRQIYKCFSCGAGGNVFTFVKNYENISFIEAVKKMADKASIPLSIYEKKKPSKNKRYYEMYDIALKFYQNNLSSKEGVEAISYLKKRNINKDSRSEFHIGLSLKNNKLLTSLLLKKGYTKKELLDFGLATGEDVHDIYYNRIMFPIFDLEGNPVGFSGRIYDSKDNFKYINTKETPIFKKGEVLYHYDKAKNKARSKGEVIVVEGFMDVIRMYEAGFDNVVATMGTAVTKEQLAVIKKMAKKVILLFDGDDAGKKASYVTSKELEKSQVDVKIVVLEDNLDPDEYILKYGKEKIVKKIENAIAPMAFKLEYLKQGKDMNTAEGESDYLHLMIDELNEIDDVILKEAMINKIAEETTFDISFIKSQLKGKEKVTVKKEVKNEKIDRYEKAEKRFLYYMVNDVKIIELYLAKVHFLNTYKYRMLAREISYFYEDHGYVSLADLISYFRENELLSKTLEEVMAQDLKEEAKEEEINDYIYMINENKIQIHMAYLKNKLKEEKDEAKKLEYLNDIVEDKKRLEEDRKNYERN